MAASRYVPERGDIVWVDFSPQEGHEQAGKRPALVLSPRIYNEQVGLMLCCPITTQIKGYPFEVVVKAIDKPGVVLADQVKSMDWSARHAEKVGAAPAATVKDVIAKVKALLSI
jgi:mRNA interferase MazF